MKNTLLSLATILLVTACSPKSERASTDSTVTPQFSVAAGDVASASADSSVVHIEFSKAKAEAFRNFTKEHVDQKVQVVVGTKVVAEPVIRSEIPGGKIDVSFSSAEEARAFSASLSHK
jgi:preprotein translocase subunit SecD